MTNLAITLFKSVLMCYRTFKMIGSLQTLTLKRICLILQFRKYKNCKDIKSKLRERDKMVCWMRIVAKEKS